MIWFKLATNAIFDPKFDTVAARAGADRSRAVLVFQAAMSWCGEHNGSLDRFDLEDVAHGLRIALDEVRRIWQALVDKGMVAAGTLRGWAARQAGPARPVSAGALRVRRYRARRRALQGGVTGNDPPGTPLENTEEGRTPPYSPPPSGGTAALIDEPAGAREAEARPPDRAAPGDGRGRRPQQGELIYSIPGGRSHAAPRSRRPSAHQARAERIRRVSAAVGDALGLSG